jgi:hypothetical protein
MRITCPGCGAQYSLEAALQADAGREALMRALQMPAPLARLWAQYLAMFRSKSRALAMDRAERLMAELLPSLDEQMVRRNGVTRPAPLAVWEAALREMVELRNAGKLTLPLKSHGYLLEIVFSAADKIDAKAEREREDERKRGDHRKASSQSMERRVALSRIRGDLELGMIERADAVELVRQLGYPEDALK